MTYEEVEPLRERLCRIWFPGHDFLSTRMGFMLDEDEASFTGRLDPTIEWYGVLHEGDQFRQLTLTLAQFSESDPGHLLHYLQCNSIDGKLQMEFYKAPVNHEFLDRALNWFRRNCWLSGCPLEASATEKMEWLQIFADEDVESWQLTF